MDCIWNCNGIFDDKGRNCLSFNAGFDKSKCKNIIMKLYLTQNSSLHPTITEIECERQSESKVWVNGSMHNKRSSWKNYFSTREEAKAWLISEGTRELRIAETHFKNAKDRLDKYINL